VRYQAALRPDSVKLFDFTASASHCVHFLSRLALASPAEKL